MPDPLDRLPSLDDPRPLPEALRARLQDALLGSEARPLTEDQATSLSAALRDPVGELLTGLDSPRPLTPTARGRLEAGLARRQRRAPLVAAAAAAAAVVVAVVVLALPGSRPPAVTSLATPTPTSLVGSGTAGVAAGTTGGDSAGAGGTAAPLTAGAPPQVPVQRAVGGSAGAGVTSGPSARPSPTVTPRRAPTVDALAPSSGPAGTWVTLTGHDLVPALRVSFGDVPASELRQVSSTTVRALAPAHLPGPVDVVLTTAAGSSAPRRYLYLP